MQCRRRGRPEFDSWVGKKEMATNSSILVLGNLRGRRAWKDTVQGVAKESDMTSLVAQTVKNPPAMREAWGRSLCWEDALEKGMATHSSILAWRIPVDRVHGG